MTYKKGDELIIKIKENFGYAEPSIRHISVLIIGHSSKNESDDEYLCYVPHYEHINDSFKLTKKHQTYYGFEKKFLNEEAIVINSNTEIFKHIKAPEGERCNRCDIFFEGAQKVNNAFFCALCTQNPYR